VENPKLGRRETLVRVQPNRESKVVLDMRSGTVIGQGSQP
jgi:hypothetical protein